MKPKLFDVFKDDVQKLYSSFSADSVLLVLTSDSTMEQNRIQSEISFFWFSLNWHKPCAAEGRITWSLSEHHVSILDDVQEARSCLPTDRYKLRSSMIPELGNGTPLRVGITTREVVKTFWGKLERSMSTCVSTSLKEYCSLLAVYSTTTGVSNNNVFFKCYIHKLSWSNCPVKQKRRCPVTFKIFL